MRRWGIAIVVVLAAVVGVAPTAHADVRPYSYGAASGWMDGDMGDCWGHYDLEGHFAFNEVPSVDTTAVLTFSGRCTGYVSDPPMNASITAPEFSGSCYAYPGDISVAVNPFVGVPLGNFIEPQCGVTMADGTYQELTFDIYLPLNTGLSQNTTGIFAPATWLLI